MSYIVILMSFQTISSINYGEIKWSSFLQIPLIFKNFLHFSFKFFFL